MVRLQQMQRRSWLMRSQAEEVTIQANSEIHIERFRENSGTSKQINTKKDLKHLTCQHNIQARLYSGDGPDRIYQLLGDNHVKRWLSTTCDDTYNDRELWPWLIEFLEKKLSSTTEIANIRWWEKVQITSWRKESI